MEFNEGGRLSIRTVLNPDGSESEAQYFYNFKGDLLRISSGTKGSPFTETINEFDSTGRIQKIISSGRSHEVASFNYDPPGKKKVQISLPEDYRSDISFAGSPFALNDRAPNLPGGGTATTLYDNLDRPCEIQVRDGAGELLKHVVRTYDEGGNIIEEAEIAFDVLTSMPWQFRDRVLSHSGISANDLRKHLSTMRISQSATQWLKHEYDAQGRVIKTYRRLFNREETVEAFYNDQGDTIKEVTRLKMTNDQPAEETGYSEAVYSYQYDLNGNWTEKTVSYRPKPEDPFKVISKTTRTLTYY